MTQVEMLAGLKPFGLTLTAADVDGLMNDVDNIDFDTFIQLITKGLATDAEWASPATSKSFFKWLWCQIFSC